MTKRSRHPLLAAELLLLMAGNLALSSPAWAIATPPPWTQTSTTVNGQTIQEIRFGGVSDSKEVVVTVITNGPVGGTTSMFVTSLQLSLLLNGPVITFSSLIAQGSVFSLGGGCEYGGATISTAIENFRPIIVSHVEGGGFDLTAPTIAGNDTYVSAECATADDRSQVLFAFQNQTQSRIELYRRNATGTQAAGAGFANVLSTFDGGMRPAFARSEGADFNIAYQRNDNGSIRDVLFNGTTFQLGQNCNVFTPLMVPGVFNGVFEARKAAGAQLQTGFRLGLYSDFDRNGITDYATPVPAGGCTVQTMAGGSAAGAAPYNWAGSVALLKPGGRYSFYGNAAGFFWVDSDTGAKNFMTPPPFRAGGPVDAIAVRDGDTGRFAILAAGVSTASPNQLTFAYLRQPIITADTPIQRTSFEDIGPTTVIRGNQ